MDAVAFDRGDERGLEDGAAPARRRRSVLHGDRRLAGDHARHRQMADLQREEVQLALARDGITFGQTEKPAAEAEAASSSASQPELSRIQSARFRARSAGVEPGGTGCTAGGFWLGPFDPPPSRVASTMPPTMATSAAAAGERPGSPSRTGSRHRGGGRRELTVAASGANAAETRASKAADAGRAEGSGDRQWRMISSSRLGSSGTESAGSGRGRCVFEHEPGGSSRTRTGLPGDQLVHDGAERIDVGCGRHLLAGGCSGER